MAVGQLGNLHFTVSSRSFETFGGVNCFVVEVLVISSVQRRILCQGSDKPKNRKKL